MAYDDGPHRALPAAAVAAAFLSGGAALVDELVWIRLLALEIGATAPALAWVLAVFFGGLAAGAAAAPRLAAQRRARAAYALCEITIAAFALASPRLLAWGGGATSALWLILPTAAMGTTLPLLCSALGAGGVGASRLYVVNTLGGATGVAAAGFLGLEILGLSGSLCAAAGANAAAALLALALRPRAVESGSVRGAASAPLRAALGLAFAAGFVSIVAEVVLNRLLYQVLGGTTYAISFTLFVFLLAMAAGSAASARRPMPADAVRSLGWGFAVLGLAVAASLLMLDPLAAWMRRLASREALTLGSALGRSAVVASLVLAPPAVASGWLFPWIVRWRGGSGSAALGSVYASNTAGAIAASLAATFLLVPAMGTAWTLLAAGGAALFVGILLARGPGRVAAILAAAALGGLLAVAPPRTERYRLWLYEELAETADLEGAASRAASGAETTILHLEGVGATASVYERRRPGGAVARDFAINGKKEASTDFEALRNQLVLGHLPVLLHPNPKKALVVGLGAGVTGGAVASHEGLGVTIAELAPEVARATREFTAANHGVLDLPNVSLVFQDGRRVAAERQGFFDVVTSDPIHPWVSGAASLYTRDYFALVARALAPGGVAAHWLPLYEMRPEDAAAIFRSFAAALPHCCLWVTFAGDAVLIGAKEPLRVELPRLAARARAPAVGADLRAVKLDDPLRLLAGLAVPPESDSERGASLVTDDRNFLEFHAARSLYIPGSVGPNLRALAARAWGAEELLRFLGIGETPSRARLAALASANRASTLAAGALRSGDPDAADLVVAAWVVEPDGEQLAPFLQAPGLRERLAKPRSPAEILVAASARARLARRSGAPVERVAAELAAAAEQLRGALARPALGASVERALRRQLSIILGELRDYDGALEALAPLLGAPDADPGILRVAARALDRLGRDEEARALLARARAADLRD